MLINHLVDLGHQSDSFAEGDDDALVVGDVVLRQGAAFAIFEPLFANLVAANVEVPDVFRHSFKALGRVDLDGVILVLNCLSRMHNQAPGQRYLVASCLLLSPE